jgi:predicted metal-dependent hydrolase
MVTKEEVECYTKLFCNSLGLPSPIIKWRNMNKALGNCRSINGGWNINCITYCNELICYPIESIIKVIKHECIHLLIPNHSIEFHQMAKVVNADIYAYSRKKKLR